MPLPDEKLYELCQKYGERALFYRRKFIGLLPEVNRRRLYEKKGFSSIFEFAFKLAGLTEAQVKRAISLDQKFEDKPVLREALVSGKISINKLARVASIATSENQGFLVNQMEILPKSAVETLVRDLKFGQKTENQNGLFKGKNETEFVPGHRTRAAAGGECVSSPSPQWGEGASISNLSLSPEVIEKLSALQNKGLDVNEMILEFLKEREEKIKQEKLKIAQEQEAKMQVEKGKLATIEKKPASRYIPIKIKKILHSEHGTKCAIPHCQKPAQTIHHTARFALAQNHNPNFLAPLCREHHLIAHSIDERFTQKRSTVQYSLYS